MDHAATAPDPRARVLKQGLVAVLLVLGLLVLALLVRELRLLAGLLRQAERVPAVVYSRSGENTMALEVDRSVLERAPGLRLPQDVAVSREDRVLVEVATPPYLWSGAGDELMLVIDAADPSATRVLEVGATGAPLAAKLGLLALLGLAWQGVRRLPWGQDRIWIGGRWDDSARSALRPGRHPNAGQQLNDPRSHRRGTSFWAGFFALATLAVVVGGALAWEESPIEVAATALLVFVFDLVMAYSWIETRTRRIQWDEQGVADGSFFDVRRVPWTAIARFERVNVKREDQERYDRAPVGRNKGRMRPPSVFEWIASDKGGRELLSLPVELEQQPAFQDLQRRTVSSAPSVFGAAVVHGADIGDRDDEDDDVPTHAAPALQMAARLAHSDRLRARFRRATAWGAAMLLLPFVLAFALSTWQTLRFVHLSERAEGTVVEKTEDGLPQLVVAYTPVRGPELRIHSDGHAGNAGISVGDRITVFHDADDPSNARLDQFVELWLWPLIFGGLLLAVAVPVGLIWRRRAL